MAGSTGFLISARGENVDAVYAALCRASGSPAPTKPSKPRRIERGFPWFGRDITDRNLPQEIGRDRLAISFVKGCYLGQETVAYRRSGSRKQNARGGPLPGAHDSRVRNRIDGWRSAGRTCRVGQLFAAAGRTIRMAFVRRGGTAPVRPLTQPPARRK